MTVIYCARWVLPVSSPPIEDGAVAVDGEYIVAVDERASLKNRFPAARLEDLRESAILPGLINVHSHLELTAMRGFLDSEEADFVAWLKKLTIARLQGMTPEDIYVSAAWGACEAARAGITCLGDASSAAVDSMRALIDVGLRGTIFQESFGPDPRKANENFSQLIAQVSNLRKLETARVRTGVSPHAPYSVCAEQLKLIAELASAERLPLMMHAAESPAERLLLCEGGGLFSAGLAARGIEWIPPRLSTIKYLKETGILKTEPLLAHCIDVDDVDIDIMVATGTRVAHCPKSNAKLSHGRAPLAKFLAQGVIVGLGSDSVASNNTCDLIEEARFATLLARLDVAGVDTEPAVNASAALSLATIGGARALKLQEQIGELRPGLQADFAVVSLAGVHQLPIYDPVSALLFSSSGRDVVLTVVAGREVFREGRITTVDEDQLREKIRTIAMRLGN